MAVRPATPPPPKYQVFDALNRKKPPANILDLHGFMIESEEELQHTLTRIADYGVKDAETIETLEEINLLKTNMRDYRLEKKAQYREAFCIQHNDLLEEKDNGKNDHTLTSHERSHKELAREDKAEKVQICREEPSIRHRIGKQGMDTQNSIREKLISIKKNPASDETIPYAFIDPCPTSMRHLTVREFSASEINWKMMTAFRPLSRMDESIFSRLVTLDRLDQATRKREDEYDNKNGGDPFIIAKQPSNSRGGVAERFIKVCDECEDEYCDGTCIVFQYDSFQRLEKREEDNSDENKISKSNIQVTMKNTKKRKKRKASKKT